MKRICLICSLSEMVEDGYEMKFSDGIPYILAKIIMSFDQF